jgi:hypothetical protein
MTETWPAGRADQQLTVPVVLIRVAMLARLDGTAHMVAQRLDRSGLR